MEPPRWGCADHTSPFFSWRKMRDAFFAGQAQLWHWARRQKAWFLPAKSGPVKSRAVGVWRKMRDAFFAGQGQLWHRARRQKAWFLPGPRRGREAGQLNLGLLSSGPGGTGCCAQAGTQGFAYAGTRVFSGLGTRGAAYSGCYESVRVVIVGRSDGGGCGWGGAGG